MKKFLEVLIFTKNHIWQIVSAFFGGLFVIFGLACFVRGKQLKQVRDEGRISMVKGMVKELKLRREWYNEMKITDLEILRKLEQERAVLLKEIETARDTAGMTNEEALNAFERLGY